ncbi:unnamed protein product [Adineta steineri]|uniref:Uncharacterized protein n=1 Tax=Adineta steineri TaxID=433720 RepID=A0A818NRY2_9BILA|nr:unnamed protein product [Adineta steineri]CAF3609172.1 unnamed protein product [Adineta steineri]CAF3910371.1 unnamed protein product [Adineta steineri]
MVTTYATNDTVFSVGLIIAIVIPCVVGLALLIAGCIVLYCLCKKPKTTPGQIIQPGNFNNQPGVYNNQPPVYSNQPQQKV